MDLSVNLCVLSARTSATARLAIYINRFVESVMSSAASHTSADFFDPEVWSVFVAFLCPPVHRPGIPSKVCWQLTVVHVKFFLMHTCKRDSVREVSHVRAAACLQTPRDVFRLRWASTTPHVAPSPAIGLSDPMRPFCMSACFLPATYARLRACAFDPSCVRKVCVCICVAVYGQRVVEFLCGRVCQFL